MTIRRYAARFPMGLVTLDADGVPHLADASPVVPGVAEVATEPPGPAVGCLEFPATAPPTAGRTRLGVSRLGLRRLGIDRGRAGLTLTRARLAEIGPGGFDRMVRWLDRAVESAERPVTRAADPAEVAATLATVRRAADALPLRTERRHEAAATVRLLAAAGSGAVFCLGCTIDPLTAYTWVETLDGVPVTDDWTIGWIARCTRLVTVTGGDRPSRTG